jgi:5,10-methylenetetrahydrofolate reductase
MSFRERLAECPIVFEVVPPVKRSDDHLADVKEIAEIVESARVDAVNIPEIKGGGPDRLEPLEYAGLLRKSVVSGYVANKVVVHLRGKEFEHWVDAAKRSGIDAVVAVGGERSNIHYPGPTVLEANKALKAHAPGLLLGNITIQTRREEERKLLDKTLIGTNFFTSQVTYESESPKRVLRRYQDLCRLFSVKPATIIFGLSHVGSKRDIEFLRILGVNIPAEIDSYLLRRSEGVEERSMETTLRVWQEIAEFKKEYVPDVPIGATIEPILKGNIKTCAEIATRVREIAEEVGIRKK